MPFGLAYKASQHGGPLRQGEVLSNVIQHVVTLIGNGSDPQVGVAAKVHPFASVLTQDCDLAQDYTARNSLDEKLLKQQIPNILLCEMTIAEVSQQNREVIAGSDVWKRVRQNKDERFQYLRGVTANEEGEGQGFSALLVDFKRVFTLPTTAVYAQLEQQARRRTQLSSPYPEHLCIRYANFLARVALPQDHYDPAES